MSGTPSIPGWYINFQAAVIKQLPCPGEISQDIAEGWDDNQANLKKVLTGCLLPPVAVSEPQPKPAILRCISIDEMIVIGATTGAKTIASAADVFTWGIDSNFKNWGLDVPGEAKPNTPVRVYEMVADGNFKTIYNSIGRSLNELCFTQEQIIAFVHDHKKWLRTGGYATFFLFKVADKFFAANAYLNADEGPSANVSRFSDDYVWGAYYRLRFVLPQALES